MSVTRIVIEEGGANHDPNRSRSRTIAAVVAERPCRVAGPGATASCLRLIDGTPAGAIPGGRPAGPRRYDFLGPPRAAGELGWLAQYRVKSLIGEGGIGLVFLAEDTHLARSVALKIIKPELADAPRVQGRFVREAQATAAIKHDHIVTIYQVGRANDTLFLAMEYLRGLSLQGWLERGRKPSVDLALRLGREIASGLSAAHRNGLVHRDVKPANIWLEAPSGRVKILDFGMARSEHDEAHITQTGTVMGTPAYMAPEQARGETAGAGADLFSLGSVLYRLCAGRLPFEGESILAVLSSLASDTPRPLREVDPSAPPALEELVARLLTKDPRARPDSAQAVVDAIRAIERELLADRQRAELSDDSPRPAHLAAPAPPAVIAEADHGTPRPATSSRLRAWRISAVVLATLTLGALIVARPRRGMRETPAAAGARVAAAAATKPGADPALPRVGADRSIAEAATAPRPTIDLAAPGGRLMQPAHVESDQTAVRRDLPAKDRATPPPQAATPDAGRMLAMPARDEWRTPIDPDGDCKFEFDRKSDRIEMDVPGTPHALSAELQLWNAPRVLRPARGDFDASVVVGGVFHPSGRATMKDYAPYHGAGILLWQDEGNYVRLEIAADLHHGKPRSYANFELRKAGGLAVSKGLAIKDGSTHLLLERRRGEVRAAFGPDGSRWTWFAPLAVEFDDRLSVGVTAINSATKPLIAELDVFTLTRKSRVDGGPDGNDAPRRASPPSSP